MDGAGPTGRRSGGEMLGRHGGPNHAGQTQRVDGSVHPLRLPSIAPPLFRSPTASPHRGGGAMPGRRGKWGGSDAGASRAWYLS